MKTLQDCKRGDELISLGFPENLLVDDEDCERLIGHCKAYDMEFLKDSYGTIVNKAFKKHFKKAESISDNLMPKTMNIRILDHSNMIQCRHDKDIEILTSSPYLTLDEPLFNELKNYHYNIYVINPNFLDYIEFARQSYGKVRDPISNINYAFTEAVLPQMWNLNRKIHEDIGVYPAFTPLKLMEEQE